MDAVIITSHYINKKICDNLLKPIVNNNDKNREYFLLYHSEDEISVDIPFTKQNIIKFTDNDMHDFSKFYKNAWYSVTEKLLFFYSLFKSYKNYWFVEYDVAYTGDNWTNLLDCIDQEFEKYDLITSGDYWVPSPDWFAYDSFEGFIAHKKDLIASFIFMCRISNKLFSSMFNCKDFQSGYCELYFPVFAKANDFITASIPTKYASPIWAPHLKINEMSYQALKCNFPDKLFHSITYN